MEVIIINKIDLKNLYTDKLELKISTMEETDRFQKILVNKDINQYYFPNPYRIFVKNSLYKDIINN